MTLLFLKLCSAVPQVSGKDCQGFLEKKIREDGRVLLTIVNFYVRINIRAATFDTNYSVTDSKQSIATSVQKLPDSVVKSVSRDRHRRFPCVGRNDEVIDQFEVSF